MFYPELAPPVVPECHEKARPDEGGGGTSPTGSYSGVSGEKGVGKRDHSKRGDLQDPTVDAVNSTNNSSTTTNISTTTYSPTTIYNATTTYTPATNTSFTTENSSTTNNTMVTKKLWRVVCGELVKLSVKVNITF